MPPIRKPNSVKVISFMISLTRVKRDCTDSVKEMEPVIDLALIRKVRMLSVILKVFVIIRKRVRGEVNVSVRDIASVKDLPSDNKRVKVSVRFMALVSNLTRIRAL